MKSSDGSGLLRSTVGALPDSISESVETHVNLTTQSDTEILAIVRPIMDNLMDASTAVDYDRHVRDFTERAKRMLSRERLQSVCAEYQSTKGHFAQRDVVAIFRRPNSIAVIWRQAFTRQAGEFVAEMVLVQDGDRYLVDHVMVF